jgi:acyl-coenzyme A thioesterase PaaI-like protein
VSAEVETPAVTEARARAGRAVRDIGHALVGHVADEDLIDEVSRTLEGLTKRLDEGAVRQRVRGNRAGRWLEPVADGSRMVSYDERPFSGRSSPWGVDLEVHRHGDEIEAILTLRAAHEGAPERSHGGIVAGLFDDVFGFVLDIIQEAAFTGELTIRYEQPTPLHRPIACRGRLARRDGRKLHIEGELVDLQTDGQPVVARGRGVFIAVDPSVFDQATQQLPAPPDEGR